MFEDLGVMTALVRRPGPHQENRRREMEQTAAGMAEGFAEVVPHGFATQVRALIESRSMVAPDQQAEMSRLLMERFGPGNERLLRRFGLRPGAGRSEA